MHGEVLAWVVVAALLVFAGGVSVDHRWQRRRLRKVDKRDEGVLDPYPRGAADV